MIGLLGKKIGMTSIFTEDGERIPVTILSVGPCRIVQIKTPDTDGYSAVQLGYEPIKNRKSNKPMRGHFRKAKIDPHRKLKEFRMKEIDENFAVGQVLKVDDVFDEGEIVACTGTSKGKGFQGAMKRHGFKGGPKTHGQSDRQRSPGSIGASSYPSRVIKGMKMPGRMGGKAKTINGLEVVKIMPEDNILLVRGSVAGSKGGYIIVKKSGY